MKNYGVVGRSLEHSFSPEYFARKFVRLNITDAFYSRIELKTVGDIKELLSKGHMDGFNVTIPYKEEIIPLLDKIDPTAQEIGSVNCVKRVNGQYIGYNTDYIGFRKTLKPMVTGRNIKALILGSGGASRAVKYVLGKLNIPYLLVSRHPGQDLTYEDLEESHISTHRLIINCTPLGTWPETESKPGIPYDVLNYRNILYDLTYNPPISAFLKEGVIHGSTVRNGKEMLRIQADESWHIWRT